MKPRPSLLNIARHCQRAPWLAAHYPESTVEARGGRDVHAEVAAAIKAEKPDAITLPAARHCYDWLVAFVAFAPGASVAVERKVQLLDEEGEVLTEGTPDVVAAGDGAVLVVDWKSNEQLLSGLVPHPDDDLQLLSYLAAAMLEHGAASGQIARVGYDEDDEDDVYPKWSKTYSADDVMGILDRIRAVPDVDPTGQQPEAAMGEHCAHCWQRRHCSAYLLPKGDVVALAPLSMPGTMTNREAEAVLAWRGRAKLAIKAAEELLGAVDGALRHHVDTQGSIVREDGQVWGLVETKTKRRGPSVGECEKAGLAHLIHQAEPTVKYDWRK